MRRDVSAGPHWVTVQVTDAPVDVRVTVTTVPTGSVRWAHVASSAWNHDARPWSLRATVALEAGDTAVNAAGSVTVTGGAGAVVVVVVTSVVGAPPGAAVVGTGDGTGDDTGDEAGEDFLVAAGGAATWLARDCGGGAGGAVVGVGLAGAAGRGSEAEGADPLPASAEMGSSTIRVGLSHVVRGVDPDPPDRTSNAGAALPPAPV